MKDKHEERKDGIRNDFVKCKIVRFAANNQFINEVQHFAMLANLWFRYDQFVVIG